jgi:hypothetical protein
MPSSYAEATLWILAEKEIRRRREITEMINTGAESFRTSFIPLISFITIYHYCPNVFESASIKW